MAHLHNVIDSDNRFRIDPVTRAIVNTSGKVKLVQNDHNAERFTFEIPRLVDGHDMSLCDKVEIHYINVSGNKNEQSTDVYPVEDLTVDEWDEDKVVFSWLISANATKYAGILSFLIKFVCLDGETVGYAWNTDIFNDITIASGMDNGENVIAEYSDVLEAWKQDVLHGADGALTEIAAAKAAMLKEIELAAEIVQTTGDSETAVMSQKATSETIAENMRVVNFNLALLNNGTALFEYVAHKYGTKRLCSEALPMIGDVVTVTASGEYEFAVLKNDSINGSNGNTYSLWTKNWSSNISDIETDGALLWIQKPDKSVFADDEIDEAIASVKVTYSMSLDESVVDRAVTVSPNASDGADYATINDAITDGFKNILLYGGTYEQTITLPESGTIKISPLEKASIPVFIDPNRLIVSRATLYDGKVYVADASFNLLTDTPMIFQDGVPDATTLISNEERMPQQRGKEYRCDDTRIDKCSATAFEDAVTEMQAASGYKFFYDNDNRKLYFTAPNTDFATYPIICSSNGALFNGLSRGITLLVSGIECKYMRFDISRTVNSVISNCKCSGAYASALGQFLYDDAINPRFINCEACLSHGKNNGDGFNCHCTNNNGDTFAHQSGVVLENCWSHDNMDDGWSDHYRGEAMIYGGLYEYNGKGGITPSYGTHVTCHDVYSRNNYNGFYYIADSNDGGMYGQMICYNCVAEKNTRGSYKNAGFLVSGASNKMVLINCKTINNEVGYMCALESNIARLIDCGSVGDKAPIATTGVYEIVNTERLTSN